MFAFQMSNSSVFGIIKVCQLNIKYQEVTDSNDKDELPNVVWWKLKKWSMHLLTRIFERYGNTTNISKVCQRSFCYCFHLRPGTSFLQSTVSLAVNLRIFDNPDLWEQ